MVRHGCESEWTPEDGDGQGGLVCCDSWGCKESDTTEWLNWTELNWRPSHFKFVYKNYLNQIIKAANIKHILHKGLGASELPKRKHLTCSVSLPDSDSKLLRTRGRHQPGYRSYHSVSPVVKYSLPFRVNESPLPGYWWDRVTSL